MRHNRPHIGFVGTGLMGAPMARRLLQAGFTVKVWNRTPGKLAPLVALGAEAVAASADAAQDVDVLITMLFDGAAVDNMLHREGALAALRPGALMIDMATHTPQQARAHARALEARRIAHLDAPVSGGTRGAAEGTLAIMVGGELEHFEAAKPVFAPLGKASWVGPHGAGQLAKLANQTIVAVTIGAVAEALLLAAAGGADPAKVREALSGGFADSTILRLHGERMLARDWVPGGRMQAQLKDLSCISEVAAGLKLALPLTEQAHALYQSAVAHGWADCDHSALLLELERRNVPHRLNGTADRLPGAAMKEQS